MRTPAAGFNNRQISGETKMPPILEVHGVAASKISSTREGHSYEELIGQFRVPVPLRQGSCALGGRVGGHALLASHQFLSAALVPGSHPPGQLAGMVSTLRIGSRRCSYSMILLVLSPEGFRSPWKVNDIMSGWVNNRARSFSSSHG
jgi:hypothetical protein